ncbi:hypothetical protein BDY21DRAFT_373585 [Lineolata rhizophorae]|uniref:Uncharacterized protein n=1 Tax=Lineolata rhizophorae TaxID=578093 RepID=A0A6A6NTK0_9PEZI|nr:hypothetical protein BDY21DRAFT_373585 [Lineolata rhizophorae]
MKHTAALERLLHVLDERDIPLGRDDVQWAFESVKTRDQAAAWADEYLSDETLLTKEEADLSEPSNLSRFRGGALQKGLDHSATQRPILDDDLRAAVSALQTSTAAIEKQCETLQTQKEALVAIRASNREVPSAIRRSRDTRKKQTASETSQLRIAIEDIIDSAGEQSAAAQRDVKSATATLIFSATERLAADDGRLAALAKLAPKVEAVSGGADDKSVDQMCQALIAFRAATIRALIDVTYQDELTKYKSGESPSNVENGYTAEAKEALKGELETLHAEIASVLQMVVDHEYRGPINKELERSGGRASQSQKEWLRYIVIMLEHMSQRLDTMSAHAKELSALRKALTDITVVIAAEKAADAAAPPAVTSPSKSPVLRRASRSHTYPPPPVQHSIPDAALQLLRHLDIQLPAPGCSPDTLRRCLLSAILDRQARLRDLDASTELTTVETLAKALGGADEELMAILGAAYANSEHKGVRLGSRALEGKIKGLDDSVAEVAREMGEVDGEVTEEEEVRREEFVERWGKT